MSEALRPPNLPHPPSYSKRPSLPVEIPRAYEGGVLSGLLKAPLWLVGRIDDNDGLFRRGCCLLCWGLLFHALFGAAMGLFGGWETAVMSFIKAPIIALSSLGLCMPSLYVFGCVGGMPLKPSQAFALAGSLLAMIGIILLGLTPVTWLFAVSTHNLGFIVLLNTILWLFAASFGGRFLSLFRHAPSLHHTGGLKWWLVVFLVVSMQMATTLRPLLKMPSEGWREKDKKFFVVHFIECFEEK